MRGAGLSARAVSSRVIIGKGAVLSRRLLQHDEERLVLVGPAVGHQRARRCVGAVVSREMRNPGGNANDFAGLDRLRSLSFDLDREISPSSTKMISWAPGCMCQGAPTPGTISRTLTTVSWTFWSWPCKSAFKSSVSLGAPDVACARAVRVAAGRASAAPVRCKSGGERAS